MSDQTPPPEEGQNQNQMFESFDAQDDGATEQKSMQEKAQETTAKVQETATKAQVAANVISQAATAILNPYSLIAIAVLALIAGLALQGISGYQILGRNPNVCKTAEECQIPKCETGVSGITDSFFGGAVGGVTVKGAPMSDEQRDNAAKVIAAGKDNGVPDYGIVIALAVAIQESVMKNIEYGDAVGPDSRGLFQQRASGWGPLEKRMDPYSAAVAFYGEASWSPSNGLMDVPGWQSMSVEQAGVKVQISVGGYGQWESEAKNILAKLGGGVSTMGVAACGDMAVAGGSADATGIVKVATEIAWPDGRKVGACSSVTNCGMSASTPAYISYKKKAMQATGADPMPTLYSSCDRFVATVLRNTVDPAVPWGSSTTQYNYFAGSPKWAPRTGALQPGDILTTPGHILIYLGNGRVAQASYLSYTAKASNESWAPSPSGNYRVSWDSRTYKAYYATGGAPAA